MTDTFDSLIEAGASADVSGWDFSWLDGRATEERPAWGYARQLAERVGRASASLDVQTGGGEVLAKAESFPPAAVATESWPPNVAKAARLLSSWQTRTSLRCRLLTRLSIWSAAGILRRFGGKRSPVCSGPAAPTSLSTSDPAVCLS